MDINRVYLFFTIFLYSLIVVFSFWFIRRAPPGRKIYWLIGYAVSAIVLFGIYLGLAAIMTTVALLFFSKNEGEVMFTKKSDFLEFLGAGFGMALYGFFLLLGVGAIYWLWLAIQMKSFAMFLIGLFPLAYIVTAPVGLYSLIFETPQWVIDFFG